MSLATDILADVTSWGADAVKVVEGATPILGTVEDAVITLENLSKIFLAWQTANNTPGMQAASSEQKLLDFNARISNDLKTGNEQDLEDLEAK